VGATPARGHGEGELSKENAMPAHDHVLDVGEISPAEDPQLALDGRTGRRRRRFSEGIERLPSAHSTLHVGRFSEGVERTPRPPAARRVGSFADGVATHPELPWERRVGSFADGTHRAA
jgi:hypothetical protein